MSIRSQGFDRGVVVLRLQVLQEFDENVRDLFDLSHKENPLVRAVIVNDYQKVFHTVSSVVASLHLEWTLRVGM